MEYLHTHNNWENSVQKHKNAYTGIIVFMEDFQIVPMIILQVSQIAE